MAVYRELMMTPTNNLEFMQTWVFHLCFAVAKVL